MIDIKVGSKVYNKVSMRVGIVISIFKDKIGPDGKTYYTIRSGDDSIITDLAENFGAIYMHDKMVLIHSAKQTALKEGVAVSIDFDGVIHRYRHGWQNGEIYDSINKNAINIIKFLQRSNIPVFICSSRSTPQIRKWFKDKYPHIKTKMIPSNIKFWDDLEVIGITNRKLPAQLYIDDNAYNYSGQKLTEFIKDISKGSTELFFIEEGEK